MKIRCVIFEGGRLPVLMHDGDACLDCFASEDCTVPVGKRRVVPLGFGFALPKGFEGQIRPRSGLSSMGIDICLGTIDSNYRGEVKAIVVNNSEAPFEVHKGDRICQLAIRQALELDITSELVLPDTERGSQGFGSTGV